jgi:hypothetical protein
MDLSEGIRIFYPLLEIPLAKAELRVSLKIPFFARCAMDGRSSRWVCGIYSGKSDPEKF